MDVAADMTKLYGSDYLQISEQNKNMFTKALKDGNISIKGADIEDYNNKELFTLVDYEPVLKVGLIIKKSDIDSNNNLGVQVIQFMNMTSSIDDPNKKNVNHADDAERSISQEQTQQVKQGKRKAP